MCLCECVCVCVCVGERARGVNHSTSTESVACYNMWQCALPCSEA